MVTQPDLAVKPQLIKLFDAKSTSPLDGFLVLFKDVLQVVQEASGWIRFALTTISVHRLICGDVPFVEVIAG